MLDWIKTAKVGDKIVCIDDQWENVYGMLNVPEPALGKIYTIRAIYPLNSGTYLYLNEMKGDIGYEVSGFRPVRPTDISIFTDMLKTVPSKHTEDA